MSTPNPSQARLDPADGAVDGTGTLASGSTMMCSERFTMISAVSVAPTRW